MKVEKKTHKSNKIGTKAKQILKDGAIDTKVELKTVENPSQPKADQAEILDGFYMAGNLTEFVLDHEDHKLFPIELEETRARRTIINVNNNFFCTLNVCPHQGAPLHKGIVDIEELNLTCMLHGWRFDLKTGECSSNRYVLDIFDVKIIDGVVWVSSAPTNKHIKGNRRDFMGNELIYNPGMGWI